MDNLINELSDLIYHIARSFTSNKDLINELYNQGVLGIYDAYNNYNKKTSTKFSSYAYMYIYGKMFNFINQNRNIKLNKDIYKLYKLIISAKDYLTQKNYKEPTNREISEYLNIDEELINITINMVLGTLSLDYEYDDTTFENLVISCKEESTEINELLSLLDDVERKVIMYKYYSGYSQSEIAKILNMSQSSVSRCEKKGIEKMRSRSC